MAVWLHLLSGNSSYKWNMVSAYLASKPLREDGLLPSGHNKVWTIEFIQHVLRILNLEFKTI
jgi:hypothetical protein